MGIGPSGFALPLSAPLGGHTSEPPSLVEGTHDPRLGGPIPDSSPRHGPQRSALTSCLHHQPGVRPPGGGGWLGSPRGRGRPGSCPSVVSSYGALPHTGPCQALSSLRTNQFPSLGTCPRHTGAALLRLWAEGGSAGSLVPSALPCVSLLMTPSLSPGPILLYFLLDVLEFCFSVFKSLHPPGGSCLWCEVGM